MYSLFRDSPKKLAAGFLCASILSAGCISKEDIDQFVEKSADDGLNVSVEEPVDRDFDDIKKNGVLKMLTRYSSSSYFLHQGLERGFEYELVKKFAEEEDLALEVVVMGPNDNPYDLLNTGKGDVIAANYTITPERRKYVTFTRPYNLVNQVVVFSDYVDTPPQTLNELVEREIPLTIRRNSSYYNRVRELWNEGYDIPIQRVSDDMDTESLLFELSNGTYRATVADNNMFKAAGRYMGGLVGGPVIARNDTIAWAIRRNADELKTRMNRFLYKHFRFSDKGEPKRSTFLNVLRQKYFEGGRQIADYYNPDSQLENSGVISPYDELIQSVADSAGLDWLMIAAIVAQETKFNPKSKSWAGAIGLMQVIPRYSEVKDVTMLYDAKVNLHEGVRIIKEHLKHYSYMDSTDRWAFALATYNAGPGHVADARRLAIDQNKNPNEWENVSDALLKLMHRQYYKDARFGFCRGIETVRYVKEIMNRYNTYKSILAVSDGKKNRVPGVMGIVNVP